MLHIGAMLLVTAAGVITANVDEWPKVKQKVSGYLKKKILPLKNEIVAFAEKKRRMFMGQAQWKTPQASQIAQSELPAVVKRETAVPEVIAKSGRHKDRFALSTGTMILAIAAQAAGLSGMVAVSLLLTGYLAYPIFKRAISAVLQEKKIRVDILDAVVISLCILFGKFGVAAFMIWVLDLGDMLLDKTTRKSQKYLTEIFGEQTRRAWAIYDGVEMEVEVKNLKEDDIVVVSTGEQVPVDGVVVEGKAMLDQHKLTGEAAPVEKHEGAQVFAMTVLLAGKIKMRVQKTGEQMLASQIIRIINDASRHKVKLQSVGEHLADRMVMPTLWLGATGFAFTGLGAGLAIINADYAGIRVAAPIALLASLGTAAKNGVLIKDSKVLELLPETDVVLFDKTGTLTYDVPVVSQIIPADSSYHEEQILTYTAAAEQRFSHPLAKAILRKAAQVRMNLPPYDDSRYYAGLGIEVTIGSDDVKVGSRRYMEREGIPIPASIQAALEQTSTRGHTAILTAINQRVAGMIELQSTLRTEASQVIRGLRRQGIREIVLISGDHEAPTRELSEQIGANRYFSGVLPHEKSNYIEKLQREGKRVMMVGDGINDSAALSQADISVSLKGASTIATDVADVVFMDGNLQKFPYLFECSQRLEMNVTRSFYLIAAPNTFCILGALMGFFGLASSLVLNNGFNLLAALNGMHLYAEAEPEHPVIKAVTPTLRSRIQRLQGFFKR